MFNNVNEETNGELSFYNSIAKYCEIIFDIGAHYNSIFLNATSEVHYFEPFPDFFNKLIKCPTANTKSEFNNFALGNEETTMKYYDNVGSFIDRSKGLSKIISNYSGNNFTIRKAVNYINEKNVTNIDFVKIDTEGFELNVLKGFEDKLNIIKFIQFEYGIGTADGGYTLKDLINCLQNDFENFSYLSNNALIPITNYDDHWQFCNIVGFNKNLN